MVINVEIKGQQEHYAAFRDTTQLPRSDLASKEDRDEKFSLISHE